MDRDVVMDPAASPARPGVRRVNNLPVAILGSALAVFLGIMAYVAASRTLLREDREDSEAVRSAMALGRTVAGDHEAGMVPAAATATAGMAVGSPADSSRPSDSGALPTQAIGRGDFPAPPKPPRGLDGASDANLLPPASAQGSGQGGGNQREASASYGSALATDDDARDLHQMKWEMFKQAVRAKTVTMADANDIATSAQAADRLAHARAAIAAAQSQGASEGYVEKLRQLQEAGLLPGDRDSDAKEPGAASGGDPYAQFAGSEDQDRWTLASRQQAPGGPYELRAGAVIPATLQTGINSDLPGQITAIVAQDVRDTARGRYVLIPQGSRLVGTYGADVKFGQERVLVAWQRIVWPDGKALDIGAMPGSDGAGYSGFKDEVDNHFLRLFAGALLLSGITGGIAYSQDSQAVGDGQGTVSGAMSQALGQQLGQLSEEMVRRQMNVAPTIEIRPGYRFNVQVTKDLTFSGPYSAFDYERSITADSQTYRQPK